MSEYRVLLVENASRLTISLGRLRIQRESHSDVYVLPSDIAVIVLHHPAIMISSQALEQLAEKGAMVVLTNQQHLPSGLLLPWSAGTVLGIRLRQQIALNGSEHQLKLWAAIVSARIGTQAANLRHLDRAGALRLERLAARVDPGDTANLEAQASKVYWANLLPKNTHRIKQGATDPLNIRLNFGYAILRSLVAREIASAGLTAALGIGHHNQDNPYNLADDLMEPYRFLVERRVIGMDFKEDFGPPVRLALAATVTDEVLLPGGNHRLPTAISETVASLCRCLAREANDLILPVHRCRLMAGA